MSKEDYYSVLNINKNASEAEIKKSYRRLAMKYHPDRNKGDISAEEKFKKISEAYDVLSDPVKKKSYDTYGHVGIDQNYSSTNYSDVNMNFSDIFGDIFGDAFGGNSKNKTDYNGNDLSYKLDISLEESIQGISVKIGVKTKVLCKFCNGTGAKDGNLQTCKTCKGVGQIRIQQGFFSIQQACPKCNGEGNIIRDYCKICMKDGRIVEDVILSVKIPMGIDSGDKIRVQGKGNVGKNGISGDLYIEINIKPHAIYVRKGIDLYCDVPITFIIATLGGTIEVPTLYEKVKIKIPSGTQTGKIFRLKNNGIKSIKGDGYGDLYCTVVIETPINLNDEQEKLLLLFDKSINNSTNCNPKVNSWVETIKKFFK
ncbi:MAG: molecular chaperone DnaJ [Candidatus Azosocius agrarius]|nr:MAG: molecular chaperone DnaJ [Gammaproteobacteria bacterium]